MGAATFRKTLGTAQVQNIINEQTTATENLATDLFAGHQWVDFPIGSNPAAQRIRDTTYTNSTGSLMRLWVKTTNIVSASALSVTVDAGLPTEQTFSSGSIGTLLSGSHTLGAVDVLPGQTYIATGRNLAQWKELRKT